jgi:hypothetical protein
MIHPLQEYAVMHTFCRGCFFEYGTKMVADALAHGGSCPDRTWAHAAVELAGCVCDEVEARLVALICCALACLAAGAFSPRPEQGRALGGAMTWAMWAIGYLILKAAVGAQIFCAATGVTLLTTLAAAIAGSCIFHKKLRNRTKKKKRKQKRNYAL